MPMKVLRPLLKKERLFGRAAKFERIIFIMSQSTCSQNCCTTLGSGASFCFDGTTFTLPDEALTTLGALEDAGHEAWFVGGFIRNSMLNLPSHDFDIATNATPKQSKEVLLAKGFAVFETGIKHGTIAAILNNVPFEITTYRSEGTYTDKRHPDNVTFVTSIEEDLARRDFTINALAFHPTRGLLDIFGGKKDLENKLIRCVGNANVRFSEDALRILRALRFAAELGFSIEEATETSLTSCATLLNSVAAERIFVETEKLLCGNHCQKVIVEYVDVLGVFLPELLPMKGLDQKTKYHIYDVLEHTAYVVQNIPPYPLGRWAALCHDMGKPDTFFTDENGIGHMYGHPKVSVEHLKHIAKRLKFPKKLSHDLALLVRYHDTRPAPTKKSVRKLFLRMEEKEYLFHAMCDLMRADALSQAPFCHERVALTNEVESLLDEMIAERDCFSVKDLPLSGADLIEIGFVQGPQIGEVLTTLLNAVLAKEVPADADALKAYAQKLFDKQQAQQ